MRAERPKAAALQNDSSLLQPHAHRLLAPQPLLHALPRLQGPPLRLLPQPAQHAGSRPGTNGSKAPPTGLIGSAQPDATGPYLGEFGHYALKLEAETVGIALNIGDEVERNGAKRYLTERIDHHLRADAGSNGRTPRETASRSERSIWPPPPRRKSAAGRSSDCICASATPPIHPPSTGCEPFAGHEPPPPPHPGGRDSEKHHSFKDAGD